MNKNTKPVLIFMICIIAVYLFIYKLDLLRNIFSSLVFSFKAFIELVLIISGIIIAVKITSRKDNKK